MNLTRIGFTEIGTLLIPLSKEDFGLSDEKIEFLGKVFEPKEEVHITVIGKDLGQKLQEAIKGDPAIENQIEQVMKEADWSYEKKDKMYHISKDKKKVDLQGDFKVIHAESIILMVEIAGIEQFYRKLGRIIGTELEVPPTHVTLYTYGDPVGIGLPNQAAFEEFVTREILPNELVI